MRIVISSEPRLLKILRGVVKFRAQESGFPASDAECLSMAIDEAAANVIRHTYGNRPDAKLTLQIQAFPDRLEFLLEDSGPKVQAEAIQSRPLDEVRPGGLGTYFIGCFMDEKSYDTAYPDGNRLKMVKYLPGKRTTGDESPNQKGG